MGQYRRKLKKGERWFFSGQYLGKKYHSKAIYLTKGECAKMEREKLKELDTEARTGFVDMSLKELLENRLDYLEMTKNRFYYEDNRRHAALVLKTFGNVSVREITKKMVNGLLMAELKRCQSAGLSNHRPNALFVNVRSFFNHGIKKLGLEIKNPCANLSKFSVDKRIKFIPTQEMLDEVLALCDERQAALVRFVDETACRIGEALRLDVQDVKADKIILYTRKSRNSDLTARVLPRPEFLPALPEKGRVFHEWKITPCFLKAKVRKLKQPDWSWHCLRHRRASIWANEGKPLIQIMALLGHNNVSTTQIYLRSLGIMAL